MGFLIDNKIKAVVFDIDGTFYPLFETKLRILKASIYHLPFALKYNRARQKLRERDSFLLLPPLTREKNAERMCSLMYNKSDKTAVSLFLEKEKKIFTERYYELFKNIKPYDGVKEVLSTLKETGYKMALLSDFPVGSKIEALGFAEYFSLSLSSEDIGRSKPCQTPFKVVADKLKLNPDDILYVGDSLYKDVMGANSAGMWSALITKSKDVPDADITVSDWHELRDRLF